MSHKAVLSGISEYRTLYVRHVQRWKVVAALNIFITAVFLCIALMVAILPTVNKFGLFQPRILLFVAACVLVVLFIYISQIKRQFHVLATYHRLLTCVLLILSLSVSLLLAYALASYGYTWDTQIVLDAANEFARTGTFSSSFFDYIQTNSNNTALFVILTGVTKLALILKTNVLDTVLFFNVLILFFAQVLIYLCSKMLYGIRIAILSIPFSFVLIGACLYVEIPYTDTLAVLFPILILYLALKLYKTKRLWQVGLISALMGMTAMIGTLVKPTVVIALIAIVGTAFIVGLIHFQKKALRQYAPKVGVILGGIGVSMLIIYSAFNALVDSQNIFPYPYTQASEYTIPAIHFVDIGLKTTEVGYSVNYGGYDPVSVKAIAELPTKQQRVDYSITSIKRQLAAYGPFGYASFLAKKADWILSDGTFFAYGEGDNSRVAFIHNDAMSKTIRRFTFPGSSGYLLYGNILQVFWLALLILIALQCVLGLLRQATRRNVYLLGLRLMIIGILLFLLIFEGRSRYLFLYVPIFIVLGMYTLTWFSDQRRASLEGEHGYLDIRS